MSKIIVLEAAIGALLATGCVVLGSPHDPWLAGAGVHPAWLAILVLAARYGTAGLFIALPMTVAVLSLSSLALDAPLAGLAVRATSTSDLFWLAGAIAVAWIAMLHEGRASRLTLRLADAESSRKTTEETMAAQHDAIALLRTRHDRIDLSLTMWRDLAGRMGSSNPAEAARAALELGAIRCGASAGVVHAWDGTQLAMLASYGRQSPSDSLRPPWFDRTVKAAIDQRRPVAATAIDNATDQDSDVAAPIFDDSGRTLYGVIALRGVSPDNLRAANLHDLLVVARWLAPALPPPAQAPRRRPLIEAAHP